MKVITVCTKGFKFAGDYVNPGFPLMMGAYVASTLKGQGLVRILNFDEAMQRYVKGQAGFTKEMMQHCYGAEQVAEWLQAKQGASPKEQPENGEQEGGIEERLRAALDDNRKPALEGALQMLGEDLDDFANNDERREFLRERLGE